MTGARALLRATAVAVLLLAGCDWSDDVPAERMPRFELASGASARVALVLGSGGPRGFAHIGVLKVLESEGIRPDLVIGTSVGAVVGSLYAAGLGASELERLAYEVNVLEFFEFRLLSGNLATGRTMQDFVNARVGNAPIESLRTRFAVAATRKRDNELVLFNRGDTGLAVRASGASPGQFDPVRIGQEVYVDGDMSSPVPIRAARRMGARVVIAVDVSAHLADTPATAPREWIVNDERRAKQIAAEAGEADVLLHPNIGYYAGHNLDYRRRVISIAERVTREKLPEIRAALQRSSTARSPEGLASR